MSLFEYFIDLLKTGDTWKIVTLIFCINVLQVGFVSIVGEWLVKIFAKRRIAEKPKELKLGEILLISVTVILNSGVTVLGLIMWRNGIIKISTGSWHSMLFDMIVFIVLIDLSMYLLHKIAHFDRLFPLLHSIHHTHVNPKPISLFILHPFETLSFGALWLTILVIYSASWPGVILFLTFNLLFGMMGHLGVEPFGNSFLRKIYIKIFATSTFHAMHHKYDQYNFGFYLIIWDKLFKTLHPNYFTRFQNNRFKNN